MKKITKIIFFFTFLFFIFSLNAKAVENRIILKINDEIVTSIDILNEIEYLSIFNNSLNNLSKEKLFEIAKNSIIRQKIRKVETYNYFQNPSIEEKYFEPYLNGIIKKSNFKTKNELIENLSRRGINFKTIKKKIEVEILWNQLILNKFSKNVKINRQKIKNDILKNNKQKKYFLSEIVFNIEKENLNEKFIEIKNEIKKNGFENAAITYSISDSAKLGGKLGWVNFNSLSEIIKKKIKKINKNEYTNPIVIPGGFLILRIDEEEEIITTLEDIESEIENISRAMTNKQLNQYSNIYFNKIKKDFQINEL